MPTTEPIRNEVGWRYVESTEMTSFCQQKASFPVGITLTRTEGALLLQNCKGKLFPLSPETWAFLYSLFPFLAHAQQAYMPHRCLWVAAAAVATAAGNELSFYVYRWLYFLLLFHSPFIISLLLRASANFHLAGLSSGRICAIWVFGIFPPWCWLFFTTVRSVRWW